MAVNDPSEGIQRSTSTCSTWMSGRAFCDIVGFECGTQEPTALLEHSLLWLAMQRVARRPAPRPQLLGQGHYLLAAVFQSSHDPSGLTIWASPARLKIFIKKLRRSLLSVGGGLSLSGLPHHGDGAPVKVWPHLAGAPIAPRLLDLRAVKHHRNSSIQRQNTGRPTSRPCLNSTPSQRCDIDGRPCRACSY